jgi:glyoxylase-like metal-dependent hydrolase (beta-lactamase superfamily II)
VETTQLTANLYLFRFEVGQAYLWRDDDGLTLIDTGVSGSGALIEHGITELGARCDRDPRSHRRQYRRALAGTRRAVHR